MAAVLRRLAQTASLAASLSVRRQSSLSAGCSYLSASSNTALPVNAMTAGLGGALEEAPQSRAQTWASAPACNSTWAWSSLRRASSGLLSSCSLRNTACLRPAPPPWRAAGSGGARSFAATSKLRPVFRGGKMKAYSRYKERFKLTGTGKVLFFHPGHRHKRWSKTSKQLRTHRRSAVLHSTYATTMKKLGFKMTTF